jgi:hypothetical protein
MPKKQIHPTWTPFLSSTATMTGLVEVDAVFSGATSLGAVVSLGVGGSSSMLETDWTRISGTSDGVGCEVMTTGSSLTGTGTGAPVGGTPPELVGAEDDSFGVAVEGGAAFSSLDVRGRGT